MASEAAPLLERRTNQYPAPYLSIASTWLPATVSELYRWAEFYYVSFPEVFRVVSDMAAFPITELSIDDEDEHVARTYRHILGTLLDLKSFLIEVGLDFFTFGNAYATILYPFEKFMQCGFCGDTQLMKSWQWRIRSKKFVGRCRACNGAGPVKIYERKVIDSTGIRLVRWSPRDIRIRRNSITGKTEYRYIPGIQDRTRILTEDRFTIESTPQVIVDAVLHARQIEVLDDNFFHFKAPAPSLDMTRDGYGLPMICSVMKLLHYSNVLRRGSEAIAHEHIAPLRWLSPAASGGLNPAEQINLRNFRDQVLNSIREHKQDPNYVATLPFPVQTQDFGGDANAMFVSPEIEQVRRSISSGLGVPMEFMDGTLNWSGSSVSLRVLGNRITNYMRLMARFMRFVADRVGLFLSLPRVDKIGLIDFKMVDDPQRLQMLLSLYAQGLIAGEVVVREAVGKELEEQLEIIASEQEKLDELSEERSVRQATAQARSQVAMQSMMANAQAMGIIPPPAPMGGAGGAGMGGGAEGDPMAAAGGAEQAPGGAGGESPGVAAAADGSGGAGLPADPSQAVAAATGTEAVQGAAAPPQDAPEAGLQADVGAGGTGAPVQDVAWGYAVRIAKLPQERQHQILGELAARGQGALAQKIGMYLAMASPNVDTRPMPQQRAPTRASMGGAAAG